MIRLLSFLIYISVLKFVTSCNKNELSNKKIIGQTAIINIDDDNFSCLSRVDTGATSTSIHAVNIRIEGGVEKHQENIGKQITFDIINDMDIKKTITKKIVDVDVIRNSQGKEPRYCVKMKIGWHGFYKEIEVNLRDRSKMEYKVLIGRRFLSNDFLVDVTKSEDTRK